MKTCKNCGRQFEGNFCPACGTKADASCPNCGAALSQGAVFCQNCGARVNAGAPVPNAPAVNRAPVPASVPAPAPNAYPAPVPGGPSASVYTGGAFGLFFARLWAVLISVLSLTLLMPAMICFFQRFKAKRTFIDGRRVVFDGKGIQLFGKYLLWLLLCIVTLLIYSLWINVRLRKWITQHTHLEGAPADAVSDYDGGAIACFFVNLWAVIVAIITLGFGSGWAVCFVSRWHAKHTVIDGMQQVFDGKGGALLGKFICWFLLTLITLGIFSFWYAVKVLKWTTSHTHLVPKTA